MPADKRHRSRTLVIEDDLITRTALVKMLTILGCEVAAVATVAEGLAELTEFKPQRLILDLGLPDQNGIAVLRELRRRGLLIKVAIITATKVDRNQELSALEPDVIFHKPIDVIALAGWMTSDS